MPPMMTPPPPPPAILQSAQGTQGYLGVAPPGVVNRSAVAHVAVPGVVPNAPQPMLFAPVAYATGPQAVAGGMVPVQQAVMDGATGRVVAPPLPQAQGTDWQKTAYSLAGNGAWLLAKTPSVIPGAAVAATVFNVAGANHQAAKDMKELVEQYRDMIAPPGIAPEQVDEKMLRELVERNPEKFALIKQEIERIEKAQTNNPITAVASGAAGTAAYFAGSSMAGAAVAAPMAAVIGAGAAAVAAPVVAGIGAAIMAPKLVEWASTRVLGDADAEETAHKAVMEMQQQWVEGQPIVPLQVFEVFVRLDKDFARSIEERSGKAWSAMTPEEKQEFALREEQHLAQMSMAIAGSINARQMSPLQLSAVNPRQLAGQQPVTIAGAQRAVAQTPVGTQQRDSRIRGRFTQQVVAQQANDNQRGQPGRSA